MPESDTDCGLPLALSVMVSEAVRAPVAEGVNDIAMVQLPPAATEEPQVLFSREVCGIGPGEGDARDAQGRAAGVVQSDS